MAVIRESSLIIIIWTILNGSYFNNACPSVCTCRTRTKLYTLNKEIITNCEYVNSIRLQTVLDYFDSVSINWNFHITGGLVYKKAIRHSNVTYIPHQMCSFQMKIYQPSISLSIELDHNRIQNLSGRVFRRNKCKPVSYLDLSFNQINFIEKGYFPIASSLKVLDLSHNAIKNILPIFPLKLNYLDFSYNSISMLDPNRVYHWIYMIGVYSEPEESKILNISFNKIHRFKNLDKWRLYEIQDINWGEISRSVDLSHNAIQDITFSGYQIFYYFARYKNSQNIRFIIDNNPIICDCRFFMLDRNVSKQLNTSERGNYYDSEEHICTNRRTPIRDVTFNITECTGEYCEDSKLCSCIHIPGRETLQVMCEGMALENLPSIINPELYEKIELHLANNSIKQFVNTPYMDKVSILDLRNNLIIHWHSNVIKTFNKMTKLLLQNNKLQTIPSNVAKFCKDRTGKDAIIYLTNNPFLCDCTNQNLRTWLPQTIGCVAVPKELVCHGYFNKGQKFLDVPLSNFVCTWFNPLALVIALTVLALVTIVALTLMYIFRKYLYLLLFTRFGVRLGYDYEDFGEGKQYDIFISYSNLDEDQANEVVRFLEEHNPPFRVCLHYRDFIPGDSVVDNIVRCIEISKCTLMMVSNNFVNSCWCNYEFKMAHHGAIEEKNSKLLVVLLEKVDGAKSDLNLYLKTNTYLERADPQFYPRLLMALPKPCGRRNSIGI